MRTKALLLSALLLLPSLLFSSVSNTIPVYEYNKPFAICLSVISPGIGQLYSGQPEKGLAIFGASSALLVCFMATVSDLDFQSYGGAFPNNIGFQFKSSLTQDETFWAVGFGVSLALVYIYNIIDIAAFNQDTLRIDMQKDKVSANVSLRF